MVRQPEDQELRRGLTVTDLKAGVTTLGQHGASPVLMVNPAYALKGFGKDAPSPAPSEPETRPTITVAP